MFPKELGQQSASGLPIPECSVHFGIAEERMAMQVARANSTPFAIDDHEFGMNPNGLALSVVPQSGDAGQRESFESSQGHQFL